MVMHATLPVWPGEARGRLTDRTWVGRNTGFGRPPAPGGCPVRLSGTAGTVGRRPAGAAMLHGPPEAGRLMEDRAIMPVGSNPR